jgi:hypothetical protein
LVDDPDDLHPKNFDDDDSFSSDPDDRHESPTSAPPPSAPFPPSSSLSLRPENLTNDALRANPVAVVVVAVAPPPIACNRSALVTGVGCCCLYV